MPIQATNMCYCISIIIYSSHYVQQLLRQTIVAIHQVAVTPYKYDVLSYICVTQDNAQMTIIGNRALQFPLKSRVIADSRNIGFC
jgi:hypothetical protein